MVKNKIKKFFSSKKNTVIFISALLILVLATSITFAWFKNIFTVDGVEMNTGMFEYQFLGYSGAGMTNDFKYSTNSNDSGYNYIGDTEGITAVSGITQTISSDESGVLYYVIRKIPGSIDLDVALSFEADFAQLVKFSEVLDTETGSITSSEESAAESIGSFWYSISSMKAGGADFSDIESIENYIKNNADKFSVLTKGENGKNKYFPDIRKEVVSDSLDSDDVFVCFRVEYGIQGATPANTDVELPLGIKLHVAQKGGLGEYTGKTHRVFTLDELNTALTVYQPRDTIIIAGNIEYKGDLNIDNLLNLVIENGSLTVKGNMRYTYAGTSYSPDSDTPTISKFDIQIKSGFLKIIEMDSADLGEGVNAGGNLYLDIPNSTMNIYGQNDSGLGNADIYIQNKFSASTAYANKGENASGLILSNVRICNTDANETAKSIYLIEDTQLTVGQGVSIGTVFSEAVAIGSVGSLRLHVQNYGTIDMIDFSSMQFINISDPLPTTPRILIDNYSIITKPIKLPLFSRKWDPQTPDVTVKYSEQNTRVIWEQGAGDMTIDNSNQSNFRNEHIESIYKTTLIDKVNGEEDNIVVHYMANKLEGLGGTDGNGITTIEKLVRYYQPGGLGAKDYEIAANDQIKSLKIICYTGYYLTEADYSFIRNNLTNVEVIDLSEAESASDESGIGGVVPNDAFKGLAQLKLLKLSDKDVKWGANLFEGTQIDEITLPVRLAILHIDSLVGIKYLHMGNKSALVYGTEFMNRVIAREAYAFCTDNARNELIALIEEGAKADDDPTNDPVGTFKERTEGAPTTAQLDKIANIRLEAQRYGDYFLTLYDDSCRVVAYAPKDKNKGFNAINEQNLQSVEHEDGNIYRFNFSEFYITTLDANGNATSQNKYDVVEYDDFVFYRIGTSGIGDTLIFNDRLTKIGDAAFYGASLPRNVDLGGCKEIGHAALASNTSLENLAGLKVEILGYYSCVFGGKPNFINLPKARWDYGFVFGDSGNNVPHRMDFGVVQTHPDAIAKTPGYDCLYGPGATQGQYTTLVIHVPDDINSILQTTKFRHGGSLYRLIAPASYLEKEGATGAYQVFNIGNHSADELGFVNWDGTDVTGMPFETGDLAFAPDTDGTYTLITHVRNEDLNGNNGTVVIPAYKNTSSIGSSAFHYLKFTNIDLLTFAETYRSIGNEALKKRHDSYAKYYARLDLNKIQTVGKQACMAIPNLISVYGSEVTYMDASAFASCTKLRTVSMPKLGRCDAAFNGCTNLKMAYVGPIHGSGMFTRCPDSLVVFIDAGAKTENTGNVFLCGNSLGNRVDFSVVSIGGEFDWDKSGNSVYNTNYNPEVNGDYYYPVVVDTDVDQLIFADWLDNNVTVQMSATANDTKDYVIYTPTYMLSEEADGLTIQLGFGIGIINEQTHGNKYTIPGTLYKLGETGEEIPTILGDGTKKYYTSQSAVAGLTPITKAVVRINDNVYSGKIFIDEVEFPSGLKEIGENAFSYCEFGSKPVTIEGSATAGLRVEDNAFKGSTFGGSLTVNSVSYIGQNAFASVEGKPVVISGGLTLNGKALEIDSNAFTKITTSSLTITDVRSIGDEAFINIANKVSGVPAALTHISLGDKLESIGNNAFKNAMTRSITSTHSDRELLQLSIGSGAFDGVESDTQDEVLLPVDVDFGNAVVSFGENSFYGAKIGDLDAPNMSRVSCNAFYKAEFTGTVDFSEGVPSEFQNDGMQTIEAGAFDSCNINVIKLGKNAVVGGSKTETTVDEVTQTTILGAFDDCTVGEMYFNEEDAVSPNAWAFVECNFTKIDLGAMESIAAELAASECCFYKCADLGQVDFTNVTTIGPLVNSNSLKTNITPVNLCGVEHNVGVNFMQNAFRYMNIQTGVTISEGSAVGLASFRESTINGALVVGDGVSIAGSGDYADSNRVTGEGAFRQINITGSATFGDNVSFNANAFYNSTIEGPATFGQNNTFGVGAFSSVKFRSSLSIGENAKSSGKSQFRASTVNGDLSIASGFSFAGDAAFRGVTIHGKTTINSGTFGNTAFYYSVIDGDIETIGSVKFGNNAFSSVRLGTADNFINISFSAGTTVGGSFMSSSSGSLHCNITLADGIALSASDLFSANIAGTVSIGTLTVNNGRTCGGLFGSCNTTASRNYRVNRVLVRSSCTQIPAYLFASAKFGTIEFEDGNPITVGDKAFLHARIDTIVNMDRVTQIGNQAFSVVCEHGHVTDAVTSVGSGMDLSNVTSIGANAFENFVFTSPIDISSTQTIATKAFRGATIPGELTITDTITTLAAGAFQNATVDTVKFMNSPVIEADTFKGSNIDTLTFMFGGDIKAEAFAEGTYGTVKLGNVTSIGGSYTAATDDAAAVVTGAFRGATIGTLDFQSACYIVSDDIPQPIANCAFANARIDYLNFEGRARALIGDSLDNSTDLAFVAGAYSPFSGARITRLNLNGVTSVGYGYFANLMIDRIDAINTSAVELLPWSFSGTTVLDGSLIFNGAVTMNSYVTCGLLNIQSGNLEFNGSLNALGGNNQFNIGGNMVINKLSGNGDFVGNADTLLSTITGSLTIKNTETLTCSFRGLTVGSLIFDKVENATQTNGFRGITIQTGFNFASLKQIGNSVFRYATFPTNTTLNLSSVTSIGEEAFSNTKNIAVVNAPVVTSVGTSGFSSSSALVELRMPELQTIGNSAFSSNSNLSYVFVPKLIRVPQSAFANCTSLKRIELPSLEYIGQWAFSDCSKLEEVVIGDRFKEWNDGANEAVTAFLRCNNLKRVILKAPLYNSDGTLRIGGAVTFPASAKLLVPHALFADYQDFFTSNPGTKLWFRSKNSSSGITLDRIDTIQFVLSDGTGVTYLAELLYGNKIEIVDIIDTVNAMRNASYTFPSTLVNGDTTYTVVSIAGTAMNRIPNTVTTIGLPSTLEYINFSGIDTPISVQAYSITGNSLYQAIDGILYTTDGKTLVMYPTGRVGDFIVPANVEYVGAYAFAGNQNIETITFTSSVTILDGAFAGCYELSKIAFEAVVVDGVATAPVVRFTGRNTVSGCSSLAAESIQICGTAYPEVLYDTQLYSLIKLTALPTSPATPSEQSGENTGDGTGGTETPETPAA